MTFLKKRTRCRKSSLFAALFEEEDTMPKVITLRRVSGAMNLAVGFNPRERREYFSPSRQRRLDSDDRIHPSLTRREENNPPGPKFMAPLTRRKNTTDLEDPIKRIDKPVTRPKNTTDLEDPIKRIDNLSSMSWRLFFHLCCQRCVDGPQIWYMAYALP